MSQFENRLLDDLAKLVTNAAGAAQGVRQELEMLVRAQAERLVADLDLVPREDFEAVRELAVTAREQADKLAARVAELEARLDAAGDDPKAS